VQRGQDNGFVNEAQSGPRGALHVEELASALHHELHLQVFDLTVRLRSDSQPHIDLLAGMYARFRVTDRHVPGTRPLDIVLLASSNNPWDQPVLVVDGDAWPLCDSTLLKGWIYDGILNNIITRVRSHFLIHAGVVAWQDRGLVLAGDAGYGKTTLVLELIRRGFKFLSDDMAALSRKDRRVHPFPRSLRIRPDTLSRVGCSPPADEAITWMGKLLLDIEDIHPGSISGAVPISHVVILQNATQRHQPAGADDSHRELTVWLDRTELELLDAIRGISGIEELSLMPADRFPIVKVRTARPMATLLAIEELCRRQRVLLLNAATSSQTRPGFDGPAQLQSLSRSQGALELLRRFQGGLGAALLQKEFGGSGARFFWEMTGLVAETACHRLTTGPLEQMADLVCALVQTGE
jgi:hypothetical protein